MKKLIVPAFGAVLLSLGGCHADPREQAADNIEENAEIVADNLDAAADNAITTEAQDTLDNQAEAVRETGQNQAEDMRTHDPDTNLSNGM